MAVVENVVYLITAALLWLSAAYCAWWVRQNHSPAMRAFGIAFTLKAIAITLCAPAVYVWFDDAVGVSNLSRLVINTLGGMAWSAALISGLAYWKLPEPQARVSAMRWTVVASGCAVAGLGLWVAAGEPQVTESFTANYGDTRWGHAYMVLHLVAISVGLAFVVRRAVGYAGLAAAGWLRRGLIVTAVGASIYLAFYATRLVDISSRDVGLVFSLHFGTPLLNVIGLMVLVTGILLPTFAAGPGSVGERIGSAIAGRRLRPLWRELCVDESEVSVRLPGNRFGDSNFRLYRRIVEIRDGMLALRPYLGGPDGQQVTAVDPARTAAVMIRGALAARASGTAPDPNRPVPPEWSPNHDRRDEVRWLLDVARHYRRLPREYDSSRRESDHHEPESHPLAVP